MIGRRAKRLEDAPLLRGKGQFIDDLHRRDMLEAAFVRSPHAHAVIQGIDASAARELPGVYAIVTFADIAPLMVGERLPVGWPSPHIRRIAQPWVLAKDEVCHVGEAVALVIADSRYIAEDAVGHIDVAYEPLPVAADCRTAAAPDAPPAHKEAKDNILATFTLEYGDCDKAFAAAAHVFGCRLSQHRGCGHSIECRGVVAEWDSFQDHLTVWTSTQAAHSVKQTLVDLFGMSENQLRVIAPNVGGGFGPKYVTYPEEAAVAAAARLLNRPIKWIEDRREYFIAAGQERDQYWDVEIAVDAEARILGVRGSFIHDHGAYTLLGLNLPHNAAMNVPSVYVVPNYRMEATAVFTNKVPTCPVRGAGHPQGTFAIERLLDQVARRLDIDPAEVRRRNLVPAESMPYSVPLKGRDGSFMTYDSGDYPACFDKALAAAGYADFPARQDRARADGRYIGMGIANFVKGTGRGPFESAIVRIGPSGKIVVYSGANDQGQGSKTTLAQVCAEQLGVELADIEVVVGDTAGVPLGLGAFASRQAVTAGSSVHLASVAVREKVLKVASHMLEASERDLAIEHGRVHVAGATEMSVSLADVARSLAGIPGYPMVAGIEPGLEATVNFTPQHLIYCNGTHVAEVEVDIDTGAVKILRYIVVNDSGRIINPMIAEGQVRGGVAHGIGNALFEWMGFDEHGQPLTTTFAEYLLPTAAVVPNIDVIFQETPSTLNPLGVKGIGESGTTPAASAIISAVENALRPFDVEIAETPITPVRIVELIHRPTQKRAHGP